MFHIFGFMPNEYKPPIEFEAMDELIETILKFVINEEKGYLVVRDKAGNFAFMSDGGFHIKDRFGTKQYFKPKKYLINYFREKINQHHNFEHGGWRYTWNNNGAWLKQEFDFIF